MFQRIKKTNKQLYDNADEELAEKINNRCIYKIEYKLFFSIKLMS